MVSAWRRLLAVGSLLVVILHTEAWPKQEEIERRRLIVFNPVVDRGNSSFLPNVTVYATMVHVPHHANEEGALSNSGPSHQQRENFERVREVLPVPIRYWPAMHARPCPQYTRSQHRTERGHVASHFQLWSDFVFFDNDVWEARFRPKPEFVPSTSYSSISGHFVAFENGTLYKNGVLYLEDDLLIVLEDSIHVNTTIADRFPEVLHDVLANHFNKTDILRLGNCHHHGHRSAGVATAHPDPWCQFSYAISRRGCRKVMAHVDWCGHSLSAQLQHMERKGLVTISAVDWSLFVLRPNSTTIVHEGS